MKNSRNYAKITKIIEVIFAITCVILILGLAICFLSGDYVNNKMFNFVSLFIALFGLFITMIFVISYTEKWWKAQEQVTRIFISIFTFLVSLIAAYSLRNVDILCRMANIISFICVIIPLLKAIKEQ